VSGAFTNVALFGGKSDVLPADPGIKLEQSTVWDDYHSSRVDPDRISLSVDPNKTDIKVGEEFSFKVKAGVDGYLVILNRDASNRVAVLWPESRDVDKAAIQAGVTRVIPADLLHSFVASTVGIEHVKAILFASREKAEAVLKAFPPLGDVSFVGMKLLQQVPTKKMPLFTSELTFTVSDK
jgi:hypothetical protein